MLKVLLFPLTWPVTEVCEVAPDTFSLVYGFTLEDPLLLLDAIRLTPVFPTTLKHLALVLDQDGRRLIIEPVSGRMVQSNYSPLRGFTLEEIEAREFHAFEVDMAVKSAQERRSALLAT